MNRKAILLLVFTQLKISIQRSKSLCFCIQEHRFLSQIYSIILCYCPHSTEIFMSVIQNETKSKYLCFFRHYYAALCLSVLVFFVLCLYHLFLVCCFCLPLWRILLCCSLLLSLLSSKVQSTQIEKLTACDVYEFVSCAQPNFEL